MEPMIRTNTAVSPMAVDMIRMVETKAATIRWVVPVCILAGLVIGAVN